MMAGMTRRDRSLVALALAPNLAYVAALAGLMTWRISTGLSPLPEGATPWVMGLAGCIPIASVGLANFLRLRRGA